MADNEIEQSNAKTDLDASLALDEVLGSALPALKLFHVKLSEEGVIRGIIGPRDQDIIWQRHILNSAAAVPWIRESINPPKHSRIADVGSGGGFPGLVIAACLPQADITLIEPMQRRVEWLHECTAMMGLNNVRILRARAEQVSASIHSHHLKPFDVVTCRAVAPMRKLAGLTLPLLVPGGRLIALKGRSAAAELEKATKQIRDNRGMNAVAIQASVGPGLDTTHVIVVEKR